MSDRASALLTDRHLVLVGLMGTGKSTVARVLADRLGRPLVDTDALVENRAGRSVREIFVESGEDAFRDLEATAISSLLADPTPAVVAAAGGVVLRDENRALLVSTRALVVWLTADPAVLAKRVAGQGHRPALDADPLSRLREMASTRDARYREVADAIVNTEGLSVDEVADRVLAEVAEWRQ